MPHLRELEARWLKTRRVSRTYDYITTPKSSGYRGIHLIVHYDDTSVEVQLRTVVQHEWSVSVERVGGRIGEDLKGSRGPKEVLDFFSLAATAMEIEERGRPVPQDLSGAVRAARVRAWPFMKKGAP